MKECERSRDEEGSGDEGRVAKMGVLGRDDVTGAYPVADVFEHCRSFILIYS